MQTLPHSGVSIPSGDADAFDEIPFVNALLALDAVAGKILFDSGELAAPVASWDITSIPATFRSLRLLIQGRTTAVGSNIKVNFNGDVGANYDATNGPATAQSATTFIQLGFQSGTNLAGTNTPANRFNIGDIDIPFYASAAVQKTGFYRLGFPNLTDNANAAQFNFGAFFWRAVAAINRVTIAPAAGSFDVSSRLVVVGIA